MGNVMRAVVLVAVILGAAPAHADATADIKQAFQAFVDGVGKKQLGKVELFIPPDRGQDGMPDNVARLATMISKPVVTYATIVPSASGKSAWLAAEISARAERLDRKLDKKVWEKALRASAYLVLDRGAWRVTATHWSVAHPNFKPPDCGLTHYPYMATSVPKDFVAPVRALIGALNPDALGPTAKRGVKEKDLPALMSDDKRALLIGSAPGERFTGGAAIKALFKRWTIGLMPDISEDGRHAIPARAGGDSELMWIAMYVQSPAQFCTDYRALFVLAKEKGGWRIVHQHYSEETGVE